MLFSYEELNRKQITDALEDLAGKDKVRSCLLSLQDEGLISKETGDFCDRYYLTERGTKKVCFATPEDIYLAYLGALVDDQIRRESQTLAMFGHNFSFTHLLAEWGKRDYRIQRPDPNELKDFVKHIPSIKKSIKDYVNNTLHWPPKDGQG